LDEPLPVARWRCWLAPRCSILPAGGSLFHEHTNGPIPACHMCQALHMPALAAARLDLASTPEIVTWYTSLPQHAARKRFLLSAIARARTCLAIVPLT